MLLQERTETKNIILAILLLLFAIVVVAVLLELNKNDYALFVGIVFLPILFISVCEIKIFDSSFEIKKHYLCGIFPVKYTLYRGKKINIMIIDASIKDVEPEITTPDFEAERHLIKYLDENGKAHSVICNLNNNEYKLIQDVLAI